MLCQTFQKKRSAANGDVDLNEESNEEVEEEEDGEYMDISEMLNDATDSAVKNDPKLDLKKDPLAFIMPEGMEGSENESMDSQFEDEELQDLIDNESESETEGDNLDKLTEFVNRLSSTSKKRKRLSESTEAFEESEYGVAVRDDVASQARRKIGLNDLVDSIGEDVGFADLKKQIETLDRSGESQKVAAPLPMRIQDRFNRQAAYEEAKAEVSKWTGMVKQMRESEHIKFTGYEHPTVNLTSGGLVGKFQPSTNLEKEIDAMLKETGLVEKKQRKMEQLELNRISKEELLERQKELAKMRSLLFYQEQKQKKVAKIKSKAYHKVHKKEKESSKEKKIAELHELDPALAREEAEKLEMQRAKERMTLKHKNTGKWAKQILSKNDVNDESRQAVMEQLRKHDELKRRIEGISDNSDGDDSDSSDTGDDGIQTGLKKLAKLEESVKNDDVSEKKTGIFGMKFMERAMEKKRAAALEDIRKAKESIEDYRGSSDSDSGADSDSKHPTDDAKSQNPGRMQFKHVDDDDLPDGNSSDDGQDFAGFESSEHVVKSTGPIRISVDSNSAASTAKNNVQKPLFQVESFVVEDDELASYTGTANKTTLPAIPIHTESSGSSSQQQEEVSRPETQSAKASKVSTKKTSAKLATPKALNDNESSNDEDLGVNQWLVSEESAGAKKSIDIHSDKNKHNKKQNRALAKTLKQIDDARSVNQSEIDASAALQGLSNCEPDVSSTQKEARKIQVMSDSDDDSDDAPEMVHYLNAKKLSQVELMKLAFVGDGDVLADFEAEKDADVEKDLPKDTSNPSLPGWGLWSGPGVEFFPKSSEKESRKRQEALNELKSKRKDAKLKNVIITERKMKKVSKYVMPNLPHGFESREQYESMIRMPLGREWNAQSAHTKLVKPRIEKRLGAVIQPMKMPSARMKKQMKPSKTAK